MPLHPTVESIRPAIEEGLTISTSTDMWSFFGRFRPMPSRPNPKNHFWMLRIFRKGGLGLLLLGLVPLPAQADKIVLEYWDKWTGFEAAAMQSIVDDFNASQDRIEVRYSAISQIDLKLMLAIAGRRPPDVAGIWGVTLPIYVENNALLPLDQLAAQEGVKDSDYLPSIWALCHHRNHLWAFPSTPLSLALYWNKRLFREAGLDPDQPPRTIAELEQFNEKLTRREADGTYRIFGHLPLEPGGWRSLWGYWFGGRMWDSAGRITADDPGNMRALDWIAGYPRRFGVHAVASFLEGGGNFASPLNPFIEERVAMEIQGSWMWNFIQKYSSKNLDIGVAPFPSESGAPVTIVESDVLSIPVGAPHVRASFEFIRFVNRQDEIEKLCALHCKFSPLTQVSAGFWKNHPNPFIKVFYDLARGPGARSSPRMNNWMQYNDEMDQGIDDIWAERETPSEVVENVQARMQPKLDHDLARWQRLSGALQKTWAEEESPP
jgi:multiple sugar transport system substrate-binding protein